ncbi:hypothetical protein [Paraburkholderia sp.]|uniref:hypothetical protein n=1 Tax=Paraburkholderia sp. TaxID=1926495 RepID=UPI0023832E34|nr:hypothetical protein [Paraburkholderia sp.]MDE1181671.1 hypothetical protein [Paraburkholderia sp.]
MNKTIDTAAHAVVDGAEHAPAMEGTRRSVIHYAFAGYSAAAGSVSPEHAHAHVANRFTPCTSPAREPIDIALLAALADAARKREAVALQRSLQRVALPLRSRDVGDIAGAPDDSVDDCVDDPDSFPQQR